MGPEQTSIIYLSSIGPEQTSIIYLSSMGPEQTGISSTIPFSL